MDTNARIATLMLHGCTMYRSSDRISGNPNMRFVRRQQDNFSLRFAWGSASYHWMMDNPHAWRKDNIEIPFEYGCIGSMSETLLQRYLYFISNH